MLSLLVVLSGCYQAAPGVAPETNPPSAPIHVPEPRPTKTVVTDGSAIVGEITRSLALDCASGFGTATFVTGAFGFAAAGEVVRRIALREA